MRRAKDQSKESRVQYRIAAVKTRGDVELNLSGGLQQLSSIPTELWELKTLQKLDLSYNSLESLPAEVRHLSGLRELHLNHNKLEYLPLEIGELQDLEILFLGNNQLTALAFLSLIPLVKLKTLSLHHNKISVVPPQITFLASLEKLHLGSNMLVELPAEIGTLVRLTSLQVPDNQLAAIPPDIGKLTALTSLNVEKNVLTTIPPSLAHLTGLIELNIRNNKLAALPTDLYVLTSLRKLGLKGNPLTSPPASVCEEGVDAVLHYLKSAKDQLEKLKRRFSRKDEATLASVRDILPGPSASSSPAAATSLSPHPPMDGEHTQPSPPSAVQTAYSRLSSSSSSSSSDFASSPLPSPVPLPAADDEAAEPPPAGSTPPSGDLPLPPAAAAAGDGRDRAPSESEAAMVDELFPPFSTSPSSATSLPRTSSLVSMASSGSESPSPGSSPPVAIEISSSPTQHAAGVQVTVAEPAGSLPTASAAATSTTPTTATAATATAAAPAPPAGPSELPTKGSAAAGSPQGSNTPTPEKRQTTSVFRKFFLSTKRTKPKPSPQPKDAASGKPKPSTPLAEPTVSNGSSSGKPPAKPAGSSDGEPTTAKLDTGPVLDRIRAENVLLRLLRETKEHADLLDLFALKSRTAPSAMLLLPQNEALAPLAALIDAGALAPAAPHVRKVLESHVVFLERSQPSLWESISGICGRFTDSRDAVVIVSRRSRGTSASPSGTRRNAGSFDEELVVIGVVAEGEMQLSLAHPRARVVVISSPLVELCPNDAPTTGPVATEPPTSGEAISDPPTAEVPSSLEPERASAVPATSVVVDEPPEFLPQYPLRLYRPRSIDDFTDKLAQPAAKQLRSTVEGFIKHFGRKKQLDQSEVFSSFVSQTAELIARHPLFASDYTPLDAYEMLEKLLLTRLYNQLFPSDAPADASLSTHISKLRRFVSPDMLDIPSRAVNEALWEDALKELQRLNNTCSAKEKLGCILNASKVILQYLQNADGAAAGADDFLPHLIYSIIRSNPGHLRSNMQFISRYCSPQDLAGEGLYYYTQVVSVISFIENLEPAHLKLSVEQFDALMAGQPIESADGNDGAGRPRSPQDLSMLARATSRKAFKVLGIPDDSGDKLKPPATTDRSRRTTIRPGSQSPRGTAPPSAAVKDAANAPPNTAATPPLSTLAASPASSTSLSLSLSAQSLLSTYKYFRMSADELKLSDIPGLLEEYKSLVVAAMESLHPTAVITSAPATHAVSIPPGLACSVGFAVKARCKGDTHFRLVRIIPEGAVVTLEAVKRALRQKFCVGAFAHEDIAQVVLLPDVWLGDDEDVSVLAQLQTRAELEVTLEPRTRPASTSFIASEIPAVANNKRLSVPPELLATGSVELQSPRLDAVAAADQLKAEIESFKAELAILSPCNAAELPPAGRIDPSSQPSSSPAISSSTNSPATAEEAPSLSNHPKASLPTEQQPSVAAPVASPTNPMPTAADTACEPSVEPRALGSLNYLLS